MVRGTQLGRQATSVHPRTWRCKDWGITWNAPLEAGGVLVGDKIALDIDVSAVKRSG
jgi:hypothetical protein